MPGVSIFKYRIYNSAREEIGFADFYGLRGFCFSSDGKQHNIVANEGVLRNIQVSVEGSIAPGMVCSVLPPSWFDRLVNFNRGAVFHGFLRGGRQVLDHQLNSRCFFSKRVSYCLSQLIYYAVIFSAHFYYYFQSLEEFDRYTLVLYLAAVETGKFIFVDIGIKVCSASTEILTEKMGSWLFNLKTR